MSGVLGQTEKRGWSCRWVGLGSHSEGWQEVMLGGWLRGNVRGQHRVMLHAEEEGNAGG